LAERLLFLAGEAEGRGQATAHSTVLLAVAAAPDRTDGACLACAA